VEKIAMLIVQWFKPVGKPRTAKSWGRGRGGQGEIISEQFEDETAAVARWRELRALGFGTYPICGLPIDFA
jgi:hypothetical protein